MFSPWRTGQPLACFLCDKWICFQTECDITGLSPLFLSSKSQFDLDWGRLFSTGLVSFRSCRLRQVNGLFIHNTKLK
jgi:hypothetical protein